MAGTTQGTFASVEHPRREPLGTVHGASRGRIKQISGSSSNRHCLSWWYRLPHCAVTGSTMAEDRSPYGFRWLATGRGSAVAFGMTVPNRTAVFPMCRRSGRVDKPNVHLRHLRNRPVPRPGKLYIKRKAVEPDGPVTPADMGRPEDIPKAALDPVRAVVRKCWGWSLAGQSHRLALQPWRPSVPIGEPLCNSF
jgi:hypothetical protein